MRDEVLRKVRRILGGIPGVVEVAGLDEGERRRMAALEARYEWGLSLPVRNLGVSLMAEKEACFVILKTGSFRAPGTPSVYMVEEGGEAGADHVITVAAKSYTVVGEEVTAAGRPPGSVPLDDSFVIFPDRRKDPRVPCFFFLPPLPFPELEKRGPELGLRDIISVSPSLVADAFLRGTFDFPPSNSLATVLVGFDFTPRV